MNNDSGDGSAMAWRYGSVIEGDNNECYNCSESKHMARDYNQGI